MNVILELIVIILGVFFGIFFFSNTVLPIICGVPRAAWWAVRGRVKPHAPFLYLIAPVIWVVALIVVVAILDSVLSDEARRMMWDAFLEIGVHLGAGLALARVVFSSSARHDMNLDFLSFIARYMTDTGVAFVMEKYANLEAPKPSDADN